MTYLGYEGLLAACEDSSLPPEQRLRVEPYDRGRLRSASLELHLGGTLARWRQRAHRVVSLQPRSLLDISEQDFDIQRGLGPGDRWVLEPGEACLVAVDCWIGLGAALIGRVEGKSTVGRAAQVIHTAGFVDPGFVGVLTLEPINLSPVAVVFEVGMPIAQLTVARLETATARPYGHPTLGSRYQGQHEVTPPRPFASGELWGADPLRRMPQ